MSDVVEHPAKFSDDVLAAILGGLLRHLPPPADILDPFAGVGGVHALRNYGYSTFGLELEPEWASQNFWTLVGNALEIQWEFPFDAIVTSPCYGNRMADHHNARDGSKRHTYRHTLGRELSKDSSATLQWGDAYRSFHEKAWQEAHRVLVDEGLFVLNISNHIRRGKVQKVAEWHLRTLIDIGFTLIETHAVPTKRQRHGANRNARVSHETVAFLRKDS